MHTTTIFEHNIQAWRRGSRRALNEGGTRASKTYSILQVLILIAENSNKQFLISVVSESLPHLKRGAIRDFFDILGESTDNNPHWSKTDYVYNFRNCKLEFFGADDARKLRGAGRDILFINEANNVSYNAYRELDVRTRLFTYLDWNPVSDFWAHSSLIGEEGNVYIHSTWRDAVEVLPKAVIDNIISTGQKDPNWRNIYDLGILGKVEGLVYPFFELIDELPKGGETVFGLDFGYSGDPSVLTENVVKPGGLYSREIFYQPWLTNQDIAAKMVEAGIKKNYDEIIADSAEPKSIEELCREGYNVRPCVKGPGSVEFGHQRVRQFVQYWTKDSLNCIKEQRNFRYIEDKDGKLTAKTTHTWSHGMDARRYALTGIIPEPIAERVIYDAITREDVNMDL